MSAPADDCERARIMSEPVIGLAVALLTGAYLLYALLHPEKF
jgi:K+-transporting ATPase KdpF subunit